MKSRYWRMGIWCFWNQRIVTYLASGPAPAGHLCSHKTPGQSDLRQADLWPQCCTGVAALAVLGMHLTTIDERCLTFARGTAEGRRQQQAQQGNRGSHQLQHASMLFHLLQSYLVVIGKDNQQEQESSRQAGNEAQVEIEFHGGPHRMADT